MITRLLAGAASAALLGIALPANAETSPGLPTAAVQISESATHAIDQFYASRSGAPLWLRSGADSSAARELVGVLSRASIDGFSSGPMLASRVQGLMDRANAGDAAALSAADRLLSVAWVGYVQALQRPPRGMTYGDPRVAPRQLTAAEILAGSAGAPSLAAHVRSISRVNPLYAALRDAAWAHMQANGGALDPRVLANLNRARERPTADKYVMVDTAGARLYMIENGRIADTMKVVVGKPDPRTQTPMMASTIYYATLNPYWHVPGDLIRSLIAKNVLQQGVGYLKDRGYQVMAADGSDELLDPSSVDWKAVAAGTEYVRVRQKPGPANSMGRMKFGFPNSQDIYLHDTPRKELFAQDDRNLSAGCVRLEDAERLARWMIEGDVQAPSDAPEQNVALAKPVPIYVTYLTAQADDGRLSFVDDIYGHDARAMRVAALR